MGQRVSKKLFNEAREFPIHIWKGKVLPESLAGDVRPAFQNPYPISDLSLQVSKPYLRPSQKLDTLFQSCLVISFIVLTSLIGRVYILLLTRRNVERPIKSKR